MIDLNKYWLHIPCAKCKYAIDLQMVDVKTEKTIFCHNCKSQIQLKDSQASTHVDVEKISQKIRQIQTLLKNFGR